VIRTIAAIVVLPILCGTAQDATTAEAQRADTRTAGTGTWRLVRTPNPRGGPDVVSIMQTADPPRSDIDLAGLTVRCGIADPEVIVVLVRPLPPRANPKVKLTAGGSTAQFYGTVIPPGASIALPREASGLTSGPWLSSPELNIEVDESNDTVRGVVPLAGLGPALALLRSNCPSPRAD
jgi:hypothetical protein